MIASRREIIRRTHRPAEELNHEVHGSTGGASAGLARAAIERRSERAPPAATTNVSFTIDEGRRGRTITPLDQQQVSAHQDRCSGSLDKRTGWGTRKSTGDAHAPWAALSVELPGAAKGRLRAVSGPGEAQCSWRHRQSEGFEDGRGCDTWARAVGFPILGHNVNTIDWGELEDAEAQRQKRNRHPKWPVHVIATKESLSQTCVSQARHAQIFLGHFVSEDAHGVFHGRLQEILPLEQQGQIHFHGELE